MNYIPMITNFLMFLAGAGLATLFWYFCFREQESEHAEQVRLLDKAISQRGRVISEKCRLIRELEAFKAKYDQPRIGGKFAKKEAA